MAAEGFCDMTTANFCLVTVVKVDVADLTFAAIERGFRIVTAEEDFSFADLVVVFEINFRIATAKKSSCDFRRFGREMMLRIVFSYFRTRFITSPSFDRFLQSSFSRS